MGTCFLKSYGWYSHSWVVLVCSVHERVEVRKYVSVLLHERTLQMERLLSRDQDSKLAFHLMQRMGVFEYVSNPANIQV